MSKHVQLLKLFLEGPIMHLQLIGHPTHALVGKPNNKLDECGQDKIMSLP